MSLDLLREFGLSDGGYHQDPEISSKYNGAGRSSAQEDDDFGDFEEPGNLEQKGEKHLQPDILTIDPSTSFRSQPLVNNTTRAPPSPSFQILNGPLKLAIPPEPVKEIREEEKANESTPVTAWPSYGRNRAKSTGKSLPLSPYTDDDDWGDYIGDSAGINPNHISQENKPQHNSSQTGSLLDLDPSDSLTAPKPKEAESEQHKSNLTKNHVSTQPNPTDKPGEEYDLTGKVKIPKSEAPPSNVPPPSVLLSLIVEIVQNLAIELKGLVTTTISTLSTPQVSSNHLRLNQLWTRISIIRGAGRIVAGRKLRWKRDAFLAQSMRIGPANAGKSGGMKLTGVDKSESRREDQETAEAVKVWKHHVGGIRSSIAKINAQQAEFEFTIPDISENMLIRTAKAGEGALTAPKCCFLCGLKRDDRVNKLDVNVEDSFGEWWVDHWGHVDCKLFWKEYRSSLHRR
ncbi:MAG: hypothetical protein LQ351_005877 [Letrouitia transgressa]|nr:MAG: hypothetical protein LQ351_005877 [Letrouitia transgressa]